MWKYTQETANAPYPSPTHYITIYKMQWQNISSFPSSVLSILETSGLHLTWLLV